MPHNTPKEVVAVYPIPDRDEIAEAVKACFKGIPFET